MRRWWRWWRRTPIANPGCDAATCGTLLVGLTDADGDFLLRANGDTVETLPVRQRVDFAELVDLTEFVTAATIRDS